MMRDEEDKIDFRRAGVDEVRRLIANAAHHAAPFIPAARPLHVAGVGDDAS